MEIKKNSELISCRCGCGIIFNRFNQWNRERKYVKGHNGRGKKLIILKPRIWKRNISLALIGRKVSKKTRNRQRLAASKYMNSAKIKERYRSIALKKNSINIDYFKIMNERNSYVLGYLFADGCLYRRKRNKNSITLSFFSIDKELIEKIKTELSAENRKIKRKRQRNWKEQYGMIICNYHFLKYLIIQGMIIGRKSHRILIPKIILKNERFFSNFCRGFFDGDGTVSSIKKSPQIRAAFITASYKFLVQLKNRLSEFDITSSQIKKKKESNAKTLYFYGKENMYKFYRFLYRNNHHLFLTRKKKRFERYFKSYGWQIYEEENF